MIGLVYFFMGLVLAFIGALPLGAVNLAVIHTSIVGNKGRAMKIAYTAGFSEVILAFLALHSGAMITQFFEANRWIQLILSFILLTAGVLLIIRNAPKTRSNDNRKDGYSVYFTGLFLGLINPPVLVYWVFTAILLNSNNVTLPDASSFLLLVIFMIGVYIGKLTSLFLYSEVSLLIKDKIANTEKYLNKSIGVILLLIFVFQMYNIFIFRA